MNKLTRKLLRYFAVLEILLAVLVFIGFCGVFRYYTVTLHQKDLKTRAETIASKLEEFLSTNKEHSGRGAYLKFLDDISMADTYIITIDGNPFSFGHRQMELKKATKGAEEFAEQVFQSKKYVQKQKKNGDEHVILTGVPIMKNGDLAAAVVIVDKESIDYQTFIQAVIILGGCILAALFLSIAAARYFAGRFMHPIQEIAGTVKKLANGNYTVKTEINDNTELGQLARETDILAEKLEEVRLENTRLEQLQKDYFADLSHELRTPVTIIRSSLEAICDGVVQGEKAAEYQRQTLKESISLQRLVNDMLELSRLQNKDFPIQKENMNLLMALEDAVRAVRSMAGKKQISLIFENLEEPWFIDGDYGRLRQMFVAALDNAIKYSEVGQSVWITAKKKADSFLEISIKDQGCGISEEDLVNIFDKFYRSSQTKVKGSGLGLAILKNIANRHEIEVTISSTYGEGTELCFVVPFCLEKEQNDADS